MKNRLLISLVVVAALCMAGWTVHAQLQRGNQTRQTWDYKWISVGRAVQSGGTWAAWAEDDRSLPGPVTIAAKIKELGDQGWELVSVTPISNNSCTEGCAGFTSQISYYFKRPK